jgi:DNA repair ATPase RecN
VRADGGSRAFVNDQPVSAGLLRELGASLVEIHGQHDDRGLLNPRGHRALLDGFAGADLRPVEQSWRAVEEAERVLASAKAEIETAERDREWLEHVVEELDRLAPEEGEEAALAEERARMQSGARVAEDLQTVADLLSGADGGLSQLRQAARRLDRIAASHPLLEEALAALDRAVIEGSLGEEKIDAAAEALAFRQSGSRRSRRGYSTSARPRASTECSRAICLASWPSCAPGGRLSRREGSGSRNWKARCARRVRLTMPPPLRSARHAERRPSGSTGRSPPSCAR